MPTDLESDLIKILEGTMEADMGIYESKSIGLKAIDESGAVVKALEALNLVNLDEDRKVVKSALQSAAHGLFRSPPLKKYTKKEDIDDPGWKQWSIETNLASSCFSMVFPNLAIGLCEWCDPANPRDNQSPEELRGLNLILSFWAIYNLALAYKDTKGGTDRTEKLLKIIEEPNKDKEKKLYADFENNKNEFYEIARTALQWPALIQLCEIHKDRQERTRFEDRKTKLIKKLDPESNSNCNGENCNKEGCTLFSIFEESADDLIDMYKSYITGSLFLLCQEYQILSMRANCRKKDTIENKVYLIKVQGNRVCEAIQYFDKDIENGPLKCLKNKLFLITLMYIHETLQSIVDVTSEKEENATSDKEIDFITDIKKPWKTISDFLNKFEENGTLADRLFPERFEWWPKILKIMVSTIRTDKTEKNIIALMDILKKGNGNLDKIGWIKKKLRDIGLEDANKPDAVKAIRDKICDESMKLKDIEDPETEEQLKTYMKVVGSFNDQMEYADDEIKKWEIKLIKDFRGCNQDKAKKSNTLDRWYMARLCARRRFLEVKDCYQSNKCPLREKGVGNGTPESRLYPVIERLFERMPPKENYVSISAEYLDNTIKKSREDFIARLHYNSCQKKMKDRFGVVCLRRWQSYTPALSAPQKVSRGGGYFVFKCDPKGNVIEGVVIDPGIYFLENFIEEGFSIQDIDAVLLTHSHIDHRDDLESILTLLHEAAENGAPKNIRLVVTKGAWDDIDSMIRRSREHIDDIYTVEDKDTKKNKNNERLISNKADSINIKWERAYHDCFNADCVGYRLWIGDETPEKEFRFTGDTIYPAYGLGITKAEDVVMLNLGGLVSDNKGTDNKEWTLNKIRELPDSKKIKEWVLETGFLESHLYLAGALQLLCDWKESLDKKTKTRLAVLCELPEELSGGHRKIIAKAIQDSINYSDGKKSGNSTKIIVLPEDVGLRISYSTLISEQEEGPQIECLYCSQHVDPKEIEVIPWGLEERLMFVCKNCRKAAAPYLLEEKFKQYRDRGRPFKKAES